MTRFLLIRHATTDSVGKRLSGRTPQVFLNEAGRAEAERLAQQLAGVTLHAIYTSPLERTTETAGFVARPHNLQPIKQEDFLEINFGEWTNATFAELDALPQFRHFNTFRSGTRIPGGETMLEAQARMVGGIEKLCRQHPGETVAIVSHSDMIKATIAYYTGVHLDLFQRIEVSPASVSIIEVGADYAGIKLVNYTGELAF
ncbi:histidine phosphatase family protein [Dyadobacter sp.]|uniref:histidine phosphatase family protein n=1 Tax=Dyadobacter sp. TaxID=1914288 RepID=UPI003F7230B9